MKNKSSMFLKISIAIVFLFVIIIAIALILTNKIKEDNDFPDEEDEIKTELTKIQEKTEFYSGLHYIESYIDSIKNEEFEEVSQIIYNPQGDSERILKEQYDKLKDAEIYFLNAYMHKYDIYNSLYIYEGKYEKDDTVNTIYIGVKVDYENMLYCIINGETTEQIDSLNVEILANDNNEYDIYYPEDEEIAEYLYSNFKFKAKYYKNEIYKNLDEEYKSKRFSNDINEFNSYIERLNELIEESTVIGYNIELQDDNTTKYFIQDNNNFQYIFIENELLDYTIMLDNYTVLNENFISKYKDANENSKAYTDVDIFIKMLNSKDYKHAYEKLDETFRTNNFGTVENFKQYIESNLYEVNYIVGNSIEKNSDLFIIDTSIRDSSNSDYNEVVKKFIVKLGEGTDFTMSFNIE